MVDAGRRSTVPRADATRPPLPPAAAAAPRAETSRVARLAARHLLGRTRHHDLAAAIAAFRADVDHVVGCLDHLEVVLDHHHGVAGVHELLQQVEQLGDVVEVQPCGGLVEDVERAAGGAAGQLLGQLHALRFAARQRVGLLADLHIAEADVGSHLVWRIRHGHRCGPPIIVEPFAATNQNDLISFDVE